MTSNQIELRKIIQNSTTNKIYRITEKYSENLYLLESVNNNNNTVIATISDLLSKYMLWS